MASEKLILPRPWLKAGWAPALPTEPDTGHRPH